MIVEIVCSPQLHFPECGKSWNMVQLRPMRRTIRDRETGRFFKDGDWTEKPEEATNFDSFNDVVRVCLEYNLKNTELVLSFDHRELDVAVPICG